MMDNTSDPSMDEDCKCGKCYIEKQSHDDRFAGMYYLKWYDGKNVHIVDECPDCGDDKEATLNRRYLKSLCKQRDKLTAEIKQIEGTINETPPS